MNEYKLKTSGYGIQKNLSLRFQVQLISPDRLSQQRLRWIMYYHKHGDVSLTCRYFGISRKTFYKWYKRYSSIRSPNCLCNRSKRPKRSRQSKKYYECRSEIKNLRTQYPTWSKYKIGTCLRQNGAEISDTTVGDILRKLSLYDKKISKKRKRSAKRIGTKIRINKVEIDINAPGALVQIDTKEYNAYGEGKYYQFTAVDCYSRKRKLKGYSRKTASCGKEFLKEVIKSFPYRIKAILTDNGSEFQGEFDELCKSLVIPHYWTEARSPNQNAYVESSHCIDQKEFYEVYSIGLGLKGFNDALSKWEYVYNTIRPHGSIRFLSPDKFLQSATINKS